MSDKKDPVFTHEPTPASFLKDLEDPVRRAPLVAALSENILDRIAPMDSLEEARMLAEHLAEQPKGGARAQIIRALIARCESVERQNHRLIHGDELESDRLCEHELSMMAERDAAVTALAELQHSCFDVTTGVQTPRTKCLVCGRVTLHSEGPPKHDYVWHSRQGRVPCPLEGVPVEL